MADTLFPLLVLHPVRLKMSWHNMLGKTQADMPDTVRRQRWEEWKALAGGAESEVVQYWSSCEGCVDERGTCKHLDSDWCQLAQLPASVNPILTMHHHMIGMACCGTGFSVKLL